MGIAITSAYYNLKVDEITLAFEYNLKKQKEKEEQREIRARIREEAKLRKEFEEARKKVEKEQSHYQNALDRINQQNPYDNALTENFFSILKTECIYRIKLQSYEEARLLINEYIYFYNNQHIQLKSKLTPLEKRSQYVA